jgi:hypothetical protein
MFSKCFAIEIMQTYVQQMKLNKKKLPGFPKKSLNSLNVIKTLWAQSAERNLKHNLN